MDDQRIVELYLLRDEAAIEHTKEKYGNRLRSLSYGIVADSQTAEECENDTYMKIWNTVPPHEPRTYLYPFLARIIRHISLNCCRSRNSLKRSAFVCELTSEMEQCIPSQNDLSCLIDDIAFGEAINSFLSSLNKEKRTIFVRRYWYLDSIENIATRLALSESKVKTTLFRCRGKLREHLEKEGYTI